MEMKLDVDTLKQLRDSRAWSQSHLAEVADISLRTIQRIEKTGVASQESVKSICAAYGITVADIIDNSGESSSGMSQQSSSLFNMNGFKLSSATIKLTLLSFSVAFVIAFALNM